MVLSRFFKTICGPPPTVCGMEPDERMAKAAAEAARVVGNVRREQLGAPSPCAGWDVRALVNHLILWAAFVSEGAARKQPLPADLDRDFTEDDFVAVFAAQIRRTVAAWGEPGAREGVTELGGAELPAELAWQLLLSELVLHAWDLARATGQGFTCDDDVAMATFEVVGQVAAQGREMGLYADEVAVPASASPLDRALAASGRDPATGAGQAGAGAVTSRA